VNFIGDEEVFFFFAHSWVESSLDQALNLSFKGCPMLNLTLTFDIIQNKRGAIG